MRTISVQDVESLRRSGFLILHDLFAVDDVMAVRTLIDGLFDHFSTWPTARLHEPKPGSPGRSTLEINRVTKLDTRLVQSRVYRRCKEVAESLLGQRAYYVFDHAIYKPPFSRNETPWHQDQAYTRAATPLKTVHFWIPLQDVTDESGALRFVPESHLKPLLPHRARYDGSLTLVAQGVNAASGVHCPLSMGGATVHLPKSLHSAGPNNTEIMRRAWVLHFGPYGRWEKWSPSYLVSSIRQRLVDLSG